jgi:hypothetical protein
MHSSVKRAAKGGITEEAAWATCFRLVEHWDTGIRLEEAVKAAGLNPKAFFRDAHTRHR